MRLTSANGNELVLEVVGYQFPDAVDPEQRFSWHQVEGESTHGDASWPLRFPALTCAESPRVATWLRDVAADVHAAANGSAARPPERLWFTEPNLAFSVIEVRAASVLVRVELDLEFHRDRAHWWAGEPYLLDLALEAASLVAAAEVWEREIARFPDETARGREVSVPG